jgi:hypothetical protein
MMPPVMKALAFASSRKPMNFSSNANAQVTRGMILWQFSHVCNIVCLFWQACLNRCILCHLSAIEVDECNSQDGLTTATRAKMEKRSMLSADMKPNTSATAEDDHSSPPADPPSIDIRFRALKRLGEVSVVLFFVLYRFILTL